MQHQLERKDANEKRYDMRVRSQCYSDNSEAIDASINHVKPKRKTKKDIIQGRRLMPLLKSNSSIKKVVKESISPYFRKIASPSNTSQSSALIGKKLQDEYSHPLFSSPQSIKATQTPLGQIILKQEKHSHSLATPTLNSFPSRSHAERFRDKSDSDAELNNEWARLSQKDSATMLQSQKYGSPEKQNPYSPLSNSEVTLIKTVVSSANLQRSRNDELDFDIQPLNCYITHSFSGVNENTEFKTPVRDRSLTRSSQVSQMDDLDSNVGVNEVWGHVNEQLKVQNVHQSYLTQQNHNISKQIEQFQGYVRDKMERTETYLKEKLSKLEDSNAAIMKTLNDVKCLKREQHVQIDKGIRRKYPGFVMPKLPISKAVSLLILNNALKDTQYMEQFVSEVSQVVTLYVYNPRKSVKSVMAKMFTLNLLIKYSWSEKSSGSGLPEFSALTAVLRAISRLLTNYMSDRDMRIEIKDFFKRMPQMKSIRYF